MSQNTFYQTLVNRLKENGLFDNMAHDIAAKVMNHANLDNMTGRWNSDVSGYPEGLFEIVWKLAKPIAYDHISEVAPAAWFRPVFAPGSDTCEDADKFVTSFWDNLGGIDAGQLTEGSKQAPYSQKHLESAPTGEAVFIGNSDEINVPKIVFDAALVKQDNGGYSAQIKASDLSKQTQRALAFGFHHKVMATGLTAFNIKVDADPADELLLTFTATPRERALLEGYRFGMEQLHAKLVTDPDVTEDGIVKSNG